MISVIVPALNEQARVADLLGALRLHAVSEVLLVDGGSADRTVEIAATFPEIRLLHAERGRARQMNAGASVARGEILLFLHADATLPPDATLLIARATADPSVVFGAFKLRTVRDDGSSPAWLRIADLRSRYSGLPYGDQAIFVRRSAFFAVGGFPDQPLMEDLELSRRLRRVGRFARLDAEVLASGRRWERHPLRTTLFMNLAPALYALGVSAARLHRWYGDVR